MIDSKKLFNSELETFLTFVHVTYINAGINEQIQTNLINVACIVWEKTYDEIANISFNIIENIQLENNLETYTNYFKAYTMKIYEEMRSPLKESTEFRRLNLIEKLIKKSKDRFADSIKDELSKLDDLESKISTKLNNVSSLEALMKDIKNE